MTPFEFINSVSDNKKYLIQTPADEKEYVPFLVNRGLSNFSDTLFHANKVNCISGLDKKLQYDYYFHSIPKKKRFSKWFKKKPADEAIEVLMEYYEFNYQRAKEALKILTADQIKEIKTSLAKGGSNK